MHKLIVFNLYVVVLLLASCSYDVIEVTHYIEDNLNVTGNLTIEENIYYNIHFAEGYYNNVTNPITIDLSTEDQWENMVNFSILHYEGVILNDDNFSIQINKTSWYKTAAHIAFSGGNSGEYEVSLFVNGVQNTHCSLYRSTGSAAKGSASFSCIDEYTKGDNLSMKIRDTTTPVQDSVFYFINFNIIELI